MDLNTEMEKGVKDSRPPDLSLLKINREDAGRKAGPHRILSGSFWTAIVILAAIGIFAAYRFYSPFVPAVDVTSVIEIPPGQATAILNASGYLAAQRRANVASKGAGRLVELRVREGDMVKKGDVIARLESADVEAALARARANLNAAKALLDQENTGLNEAALNYERKKGLFESGLISKAEFDAVDARYNSAKAQVASARAGTRASEAAVRAAEVDMENTVILAPFDGTVLTKNAEVGEVVAPFGSSSLAKAAVVTMADMGSIQVEADVSESNIEKIYTGQRCEILLDAYPDHKYEGIVQTIVPTVDRAKATVMIKIRFLNQDDRILPEMSARVAFLREPSAKVGGKPRIALLPGAVVLRSGRKVVFQVRGDRVVEVPIEVGDPAGGLVEVKKGLKAGDLVVVNPPDELSSGKGIRVRSKG